jgi:hypothetical protein
VLTAFAQRGGVRMVSRRRRSAIRRHPRQLVPDRQRMDVVRAFVDSDRPGTPTGSPPPHAPGWIVIRPPRIGMELLPHRQLRGLLGGRAHEGC